MNARSRTCSAWWHIKWLLATWGASGGLILLFGVVALPFVGFRAFLEIFSERLALYVLSGMVVAGPFIYRYLR